MASFPQVSQPKPRFLIKSPPQLRHLVFLSLVFRIFYSLSSVVMSELFPHRSHLKFVASGFFFFSPLKAKKNYGDEVVWDIHSQYIFSSCEVVNHLIFPKGFSYLKVFLYFSCPCFPNVVSPSQASTVNNTVHSECCILDTAIYVTIMMPSDTK